MKFKDIMKALLASVLVILACYMSLAIIEYLFRQDYRWWMCIFTEMKIYHWTQAIRYFMIVLPFIFITCAAVNYNVTEKSKRPALDILLCIVVGSLGVWLNHFINVYGIHFLGREISSASICGGLIMFVPLSMYIARKTYKVTGSIWTGTFINSMLIGWCWTSAISITNMYMGQTFFEKLFGF